MSIILSTKGRSSGVPESIATSGIIRKSGVFQLLTTIYTFTKDAITRTFVAVASVTNFERSETGGTSEYPEKVITFERDEVK